MQSASGRRMIPPPAPGPPVSARTERSRSPFSGASSCAGWDDEVGEDPPDAPHGRGKWNCGQRPTGIKHSIGLTLDVWLAAACKHIDDNLRVNLDAFVKQVVAGIVAPMANNVAEVLAEQAKLKKRVNRVGSEVSKVHGAESSLEGKVAALTEALSKLTACEADGVAFRPAGPLCAFGRLPARLHSGGGDGDAPLRFGSDGYGTNAPAHAEETRCEPAPNQARAPQPLRSWTRGPGQSWEESQDSGPLSLSAPEVGIGAPATADLEALGLAGPASLAALAVPTLCVTSAPHLGRVDALPSAPPYASAPLRSGRSDRSATRVALLQGDTESTRYATMMGEDMSAFSFPGAPLWPHRRLELGPPRVQDLLDSEDVAQLLARRVVGPRWWRSRMI